MNWIRGVSGICLIVGLLSSFQNCSPTTNSANPYSSLGGATIPTASLQTFPVYSFVHPTTSDHFFSRQQNDALATGFNYVGPAFYVFAAPVADADVAPIFLCSANYGGPGTPVYFHVTPNPNCENAAGQNSYIRVSVLGYVYQHDSNAGSGGYTNPTPSVALYRCWLKDTASHITTPNPAVDCQSSAGWVQEGITGFVPPDLH